jgi:hypothetical protein
VYKAKAERAKENGKLGGRPKKTKEVILDNPEGTQTKANHEPITINHEPLTMNHSIPCGSLSRNSQIENATSENETAKSDGPSPPEYVDGMDPDIWLAQMYAFYSAIRNRSTRPDALIPFIKNLVRLGIDRERIREEIVSNARDCSEWPDAFSKRLLREQQARASPAQSCAIPGQKPNKSLEAFERRKKLFAAQDAAAAIQEASTTAAAAATATGLPAAAAQAQQQNSDQQEQEEETAAASQSSSASLADEQICTFCRETLKIEPR